MTRNLSQIYNPEFFESYNEEQEQDIRAAADAIVYVFSPKSVLDIGCGPGMLVRRLCELGVDAYGWDGSVHALTKAHIDVKHRLTVVDVTTEPTMHPRPELVVCTEVAEHVPAELAGALVRTITMNAESLVVFTAAPPGQGGHDHINEQPMSYWVEKFAEHGFMDDASKTSAMKTAWCGLKRMWFYPANVMVFCRDV